jgi:hypothetical protein
VIGLGTDLPSGHEVRLMLDDLLREYYESGNPESLREFIHQMQP